MGQNVQQQHTWPDYNQDRQLEQRLREQLSEGCRLARELDERLRLIPDGKLQLELGPGESAARQDSRLRGSLAMAAAEVVGAFNEAVKLLLQSSRHNVHMVPDLSPTFSAATSPPHVLRCLPMKSPPLSPRAFLTPRNTTLKQGAQSTSSPPRLIHSPLLSATTSEMSEGSPHERTAHPQLNDLFADEAATTACNPAAVKDVLLCRKRKFLPKVALKMAAGSVESAESNTPPDDGYTWRKYGQKVIHGALYPRGYYRCTHKADMGCPAVKQVQRCDEEQLFFDVVYKGYHTCRSAELDKKHWPLAFPQGLCSLLNLASSGPTSAQALTSFLNISSSTAPSGGGGPAPASLTLANHQDTSRALLSARQDADISSIASSAALSLGYGSDAAANQLAPSSGKLINAGVSTHQSGAATVSSALLQQQQLYVVGDQLSVCRYAQDQRRAFNPLETWPSFEKSTESNRPEVSCKGPFMKEPYISSTVEAASQKLIRGNENPAQLQAVLVESKIASSYSAMKTYEVSSHEQSDATIISTSPSPSVSIDMRSPTQHFGAAAGSALALIDEDMDTDNLLSDYFKSLHRYSAI